MAVSEILQLEDPAAARLRLNGPDLDVVDYNQVLGPGLHTPEPNLDAAMLTTREVVISDDRPAPAGGRSDRLQSCVRLSVRGLRHDPAAADSWGTTVCGNIGENHNGEPDERDYNLTMSHVFSLCLRPTHWRPSDFDF